MDPIARVKARIYKSRYRELLTLKTNLALYPWEGAETKGKIDWLEQHYKVKLTVNEEQEIQRLAAGTKSLMEKGMVRDPFA